MAQCPKVAQVTAADYRAAYCAQPKRFPWLPLVGVALLYALALLCASMDRDYPRAECQTDAECAALEYPE